MIGMGDSTKLRILQDMDMIDRDFQISRTLWCREHDVRRDDPFGGAV